jgi:hypothetical protein
VELVNVTFAVSFFYFYLLFSFAMEKSPFGSQFGNSTATVTVVDEPTPAQLDPFKIPMKIVECVMNNCYSGDGTVHPGDHLLLYMNYASCSSVQVFHQARLRESYSLYH